MTDCKRIVIVGATRGMGRSLARLMIEDGRRLFLLGRDLEQLQASAMDLEVRAGGHSEAESSVGYSELDLADISQFETALDAAENELGKIDGVVVTAASFATREELESSPEQAAELIRVNLANTIAFCEHVRTRLLASGGGVLCVFSSVAGDRGRRSVGIYGASKAGLSYYLESLDHGFRRSGLTTVCVKPGFVKTGMTAGLDVPPFAGSPEQVAKVVLKAIDRGKPVVYAPPIWQLIMLAVRHVPRWLMRRLDF